MEKINKRFREITNQRLRNTSLLHQFDILEDDEGNTLLNIWKNYSIPENIKDNEDVISYYDASDVSWWENIAYEAYENENLWWMISLTNDVVNPFEELSAGDSVKVIDDTFLYQIIKEIKNISEL